MNFSHAQYYDLRQRVPYLCWMQLAECGNFLVLSITCSFYMHLLTKRTFCHQNLRLIILCQPLIYTLGMTPRLFRHFLEQMDLLNQETFFYLTLFNDIATAGSLQLTLCYAIERLVAMRNWDHYDRKFSTDRLAIFLVVACTSMSTLEVLAYHVDILSSQLVFGAVYVNYSVATVFFIQLHRICRRFYIRVYELKYCTVDQRYKTVMNIRASRLLLVLAPYKCMTSVILYICYCIWVDGKEPETAIYNCYWVYYSVQVQIFFQMCLTVFAEKSLRREFLSYFRKNQHQLIVNSLGSKMSFEKNEDTKIYFEHLRKSWL